MRDALVVGKMHGPRDGGDGLRGPAGVERPFPGVGLERRAGHLLEHRNTRPSWKSTS